MHPILLRDSSRFLEPRRLSKGMRQSQSIDNEVKKAPGENKKLSIGIRKYD
jgi:hypothetical protein